MGPCGALPDGFSSYSFCSLVLSGILNNHADARFLTCCFTDAKILRKWKMLTT